MVRLLARPALDDDELGVVFIGDQKLHTLASLLVEKILRHFREQCDKSLLAPFTYHELIDSSPTHAQALPSESSLGNRSDLRGLNLARIRPLYPSPMGAKRRILLIDPNQASLEGLAQRLSTLGYDVATATDGAQGAYRALEDPPHAVVADLFMPSISGAQLCRLLNAEPATSEVPVILRGPDVHRNRFWAEQTGALGYVVKGRMGDLIRALSRGFARNASDDGFFTAYSSDAGDVRDRVAHYLDAALFASVIAAEVRNLAVCESFDTLFDLFVQFVSQVTNYRWLCVATENPARAGLHSRPGLKEKALEEAQAALGTNLPHALFVTDDDAAEDETGPAPLVRSISFGEKTLGRLAMAPRASTVDQDRELIDILARELGGALRTATLVEESRRLARHDPLTGLFNRRAFSETVEVEIQKCKRHSLPMAVLLLDIDHFKKINDIHGHASGDVVLRHVGELLRSQCRRSDICARWGGEEFVMVLAHTEPEGANVVAERVRRAIEALKIENGPIMIPVTASIGVTSLYASDSLDTFLDRADKAMYVAKTSGRNQICSEKSPELEAVPLSRNDVQSDVA